jgi:SAM-dependent methyltransferase
MISALLRYWNSLKISQARQRCLPQQLTPHIQPGSTVLDVGAGDGKMALHMLHDGGAASVIGVDVIAYPKTHIPITLFDGHHLPYPDASFDLVTLVDVLHHSPTPQALLAEAARVSRGRILVKDHYWITRLDHWILQLSDYLGNKANNVALPYTFLRMDQWSTLFSTLSLTPLSTHQFHYSRQDRSKQVIFLLEKTEVASG